MKARRTRWTGHAASMGTIRNTYRTSLEKSELLGDFGVDGMIILKMISNKLNV
jgi:hypothetical protein